MMGLASCDLATSLQGCQGKRKKMVVSSLTISTEEKIENGEVYVDSDTNSMVMESGRKVIVC